MQCPNDATTLDDHRDPRYDDRRDGRYDDRRRKGSWLGDILG